MSTPTRHHYVPRVHIRKFKKESGYFLMLKDKNEVKNPRSSADFFVRNELNTLGVEGGNKDHSTFENELSFKWDNKFNNFSSDIINNQDTPEKINLETLLFFFEYSIIAYMRRLKMESEFNNEFLSFKDVIPDFLKAFDSNNIDFSNYSDDVIEKEKTRLLDFVNELNKLDNIQKSVKYPALIPSEAKILLPENCHCIIYKVDEDSFILPDCTITAKKSKETFDSHGITTNKIELIGIPLTPRLYLEIRNSDIIGTKENTVCVPKTSKIEEINNRLFSTAYSQVLLNKPEQLDDLKKI
ncbi:DUF4238 domain-containing protein [Fluviicola sp.]|uniref:DUF4238 domain-containing protein n=1 Tax=Fluviicola sp. TaxID=1917219 RepID=UPI0026091672|nr:DUF4238 domain-containing protein [Fluviicola sp.]